MTDNQSKVSSFKGLDPTKMKQNSISVRTHIEFYPIFHNSNNGVEYSFLLIIILIFSFYWAIFFINSIQYTTPYNTTKDQDRI